MSDKIQFKSAKLAVLIDADNAIPDLIEPLLKEIEKHGIASVKRIYGDWSKPQLSGWKSKAVELALNPVQQCSYASGKNLTDIALIIDAMDLLHTQKLDGFCIISSDGDYTRLAIRIRESGLCVLGFGEKAKASKSFVRACNIFIFTEDLRQSESGTTPEKQASQKSSESVLQTSNSQENQKPKIDKKLKTLLRSAYQGVVKQDGWVHLSPFGMQVKKLLPSFDPSIYGCKRLSILLQKTEIFEMKKQGNVTHIKLKA